jgi:predicted O-methyltransferase YrrM
VRGFVRSLVFRVAGTGLGQRSIEAVLLRDPERFVATLGAALSQRATFGTVGSWPPSLRGFDDLAFLFSSNRANAGIASLAFDEAAYLYRLVIELPPGATVVEIGRFKGGSTFLIAAALPEGARLWSYDPHYKLAEETAPDSPLRNALARYGLEDKVEIIVADSSTGTPPPEPCALVFVDGDHTYDGVRADYRRWRCLLADGGDLLFHDADAQRPLATYDDGVLRLIRELETDSSSGLVRLGGAGSLVHFRSLASASVVADN